MLLSDGMDVVVKMKINLGAGNDIKEGYVNLDCFKLPGIDIVHDLNVLPLPFKDNSVDEVYAKDVLEHVDYIPLLKDLHRIMKPGATLVAFVPHWTSCNQFTDPQHRNFFAVRTFQFFCSDKVYMKSVDRSYYSDFHFKSHKVRITFPRHFGPLSWLNEWLVNLSPVTQMLFELTAWSRLFPAENIFAVLVR